MSRPIERSARITRIAGSSQGTKSASIAGSRRAVDGHLARGLEVEELGEPERDVGPTLAHPLAEPDLALVGGEEVDAEADDPDRAAFADARRDDGGGHTTVAEVVGRDDGDVVLARR